MSDRDYAVWVLDSAPGHGLKITPCANRQQAEHQVDYYERLNATRGTYGIAAKVVFKYSFMPEMPWEDA
ncbi:hypothetical protein Ade02nite_19440 [Paractinoplanes deccanensis]|uniref:Uncharacterized protein n=1 Tax=Paractinoplanes deccanensis TaxID=113561 RepID=A0ABQ3XZY1_9ACTN|nr:hypothetical protein [Actinoplanes deccanensis]GID73303.1 hypothetical protein Ade02nite_19440 [Actinoplanes deccanensis]